MIDNNARRVYGSGLAREYMEKLTTKNRKILLIFTRDFSQWTNQLLRDEIVTHIPRIWGRGLEDQIIHYTGRAAEWYRYEDDYKALADYVIHKPLNDHIFQEAIHHEFRQDVLHLRQLIVTPPSHITNPKMFLDDLTKTTKKMYPFYTLCVFLPGPWREQFIKVHGEASENVLKILFESREKSEGVVKLCDNFLHEWLGPFLEKKKYPAEYLKLLSVDEIEKFVIDGTLPKRSILDERARGFVYIGGEIIPTIDFDGFLKARMISVDKQADDTTAEFRGTVASKGGIIRGKVHTVFNSDEINSFKSGFILVTPMTSPEYLSAMKKAAAIITDEGGLTCHAAIVSRELGIPCVIGTKIATKILKNGDKVEVDATNGIIKKL